MKAPSVAPRLSLHFSCHLHGGGGGKRDGVEKGVERERERDSAAGEKKLKIGGNENSKLGLKAASSC